MSFWTSLISTDGQVSSKNFTLIISAIVSSIVGMCVCFVLCWDVVHNGYVKTDMESMGIFMLCMGGYLAGGSVSKVFQGRGKGMRVRPYLEEVDENQPYYEEDDEPTYSSQRKRKKKDEGDA